MNTTAARLGFAVLLAAASAPGCGRSSEPVRIAVVFQGSFTPIIALVTDSLNAAGGVGGHRVEVVRDTITGGPWDEAGTDILRAQSVVAQRAVAVVGHAGSRGSLQAAPVYNQAHVVQLVPTGTSRRLADAGPWTFALPPNETVEGRFIAAFVRERLAARSVVVFYVNDEYGIGLRDGVRTALAGNGVRLLDAVRYDLSSDFAALVDAAVRREVPDAVIVAGRAVETAAIARRLHERGVRTRIIAGDGSHSLPQLVDAAGPAAEGIFVVAFWLPGGADGVSRRLEAAVHSGLGREPVASDALIYDALRLLTAAVREAGPRPHRVRRYLLELGVTRPRFRGVTGEIGFGRGVGPPRLMMGVVRGTTIVPADTVTP